MSEINNQADELAEEVAYTLEDASVIPTPLDPTLTHAGEAADAKATGDAIAAALNSVKVNGKTASGGAVTVYASDILMSGEQGAQNLSETIQDVGGRTAADIIYDDGEEDTIHDVVNSIANKTADDILYQNGGENSVYDVVSDTITTLETGITDAEIDEIFDSVFS